MSKEDKNTSALFWNKGELCRALRMSRDSFQRRQQDLIEAGLPEPDPISGLYYKRAVLQWLDQRHGVEPIMQTAAPDYGDAA